MSGTVEVVVVIGSDPTQPVAVNAALGGVPGPPGPPGPVGPPGPPGSGGGGPGGGADFPEAPQDNSSYGRMNAAWTRVLAITDDLFDGGNF